MLPLRKDAGGKLFASPVKDKDGRDWLAVILKYTFVADQRGARLLDEDKQAEIDLVDTYNGAEPGLASIRRPSQLFESKPGTDVVLLGHAMGPAGATHVDVALNMGPIRKVVRAHGLRVWQMGSFGGLKPGPARPIREPIPLIYELAWGGQDLSDPAKPLGEPRNYVGRGIAANPRSLVDKPAAQLEYPAAPIGSGANLPASFGPIHRHWQPRASFAGTYDEAWMESRMPVLPADFDNRYHVCVPPDQWSAAPLRGDEPVEIIGATPEGRWSFQLPRIAPGFSSWASGKPTNHRTHLDTVLIDADARTVELTWRAAVEIPAKLEMIESVLVTEKRVV